VNAAQHSKNVDEYVDYDDDDDDDDDYSPFSSSPISLFSPGFPTSI
jgi:hypothetical protein